MLFFIFHARLYLQLVDVMMFTFCPDLSFIITETRNDNSNIIMSGRNQTHKSQMKMVNGKELDMLPSS